MDTLQMDNQEAESWWLAQLGEEMEHQKIQDQIKVDIS